REDATRVNEAFFHHVATGLPFVTLKMAATLDGKVAARDGSSKWITGQDARAEVHRLRAAADAIMVGAGTVLADDPSLTVRTAAGRASSWRVGPPSPGARSQPGSWTSSCCTSRRS